MNANKLKLRKLVSACICFVFAFTLGSCGVSNEPEAVADYIMKCYVQGNYENMKEYSVEGIEDQIKRMAQSLKDALKGSEFTRIESESKYDR